MRKPLILQNDTLKALVLPYGATLAGLWTKRSPNSIVLGFEDPADYVRFPICAGPIVGPLANRLASGKARIDGRVVQMPRNENGRNTLHSGPEGLHRREWSVATSSDTSVTLRILMGHGACGLPGNREIELTYSLNGASLELNMTAKSDAVTLMNLAHHPYWAVDHRARLRVSASHYLPVDKDKIPTGRLAPVEGTCFDLRKAVPIPKDVDHNFVLSDTADGKMRRAAWLETSNYALRIDTDAPGLQVYSGSGLPRMDLDRTTGFPIEPFSGAALEPQLWPDAPNHANFPSVTLMPGDIWSQKTAYTLS